jgi:hypothetical protein
VGRAALAILVPMLGRPHRVAPLLASIRATTSGARVLFLVSPHDTAVHAAVDEAGEERLVVPYQSRGDYARKVNAGYRHTVEAHLFTGADDLHFHDGWYAAACAKLGPGIGVVGTNDLGSPRVMRGEHATHSLVTRDYADRYGTIDGPGQILDEGYHHNFVDDELVGTARFRNAWSMALESYVEHLHPHWGKNRPDNTYKIGQSRFHIDRRRFASRQKLWERS